METETPDISRLMQSNPNFGSVDEEFKNNQDKLMPKICEVDMFDEERIPCKDEKPIVVGLPRAGPSLDRARPRVKSEKSENSLDPVPEALSNKQKSASLNHKVKDSRKLLQRINTYADEWIILVSTTEQEIIEEIQMLNSLLVNPLGRKTSLKAKTAENISLFMEMITDEPMDSMFDPEDDVIEGQEAVEIERAIKFGKIGSIEYIEYAKEQGTGLRMLTRDAVSEIHYDLMDDGIQAYYYRNIYVERNI